MPSFFPTACAARRLPLEYSTTDSACWPCVRALSVLPRLKPACSTLSAVVAARPETVVPFSTATVIVPGLTAGDLWVFLDFELELPLELELVDFEEACAPPPPPPLSLSCETP